MILQLIETLRELVRGEPLFITNGRGAEGDFAIGNTVELAAGTYRITRHHHLRRSRFGTIIVFGRRTHD